ncbi:MAG: FAD-binding oxidoreductase [Actinomycetota bacterium]
MNLPPADHTSYDVVIVGGAIMGSSAAWWLSRDPSFDGTVLVVERNPTYEGSSTATTNSCMRQQFSNEINIRISQFAAEYVRTFPTWFDDDVPDIATHHFGYMYLADTESFAAALKTNQARQATWGAGTEIMTPAEIAANYPFYNLDGIICGSHNVVDEGYFDSGTIFDTWRSQARRNGVEFVHDEVVGLGVDTDRVATVILASGTEIACGAVVNAAGPRASSVAAMAGIELPVEPRKRYSFVFAAAEALDRALPLTIDPTGIHVRSDGGYYQAGCAPDDDRAVAADDLSFDHEIWEDKVWPVLAHRIPAFERVKIVNRWAGHYAFNVLDQNVIVGPHPEITNFILMNGFSGHGLQQAPAIGRGVSELIASGGYRTLDLSPLGFERVLTQTPFIERAVI